jgi:hypothetical protein
MTLNGSPIANFGYIDSLFGVQIEYRPPVEVSTLITRPICGNVILSSSSTAGFKYNAASFRPINEVHLSLNRNIRPNWYFPDFTTK